jgi:hypothetical protein
MVGSKRRKINSGSNPWPFNHPKMSWITSELILIYDFVTNLNPGMRCFGCRADNPGVDTEQSGRLVVPSRDGTSN